MAKCAKCSTKIDMSVGYAKIVQGKVTKYYCLACVGIAPKRQPTIVIYSESYKDNG